MVSTGPKTLFARILHIGYNCGFTQIGWDVQGVCWKFETSLFRHMWVRTQVAMVLAYNFFLVYKSWLAHTNPTVELAQSIRLQYLAFIYVLMNVDHVVGVFNGRHYVGLMNGYHGFVKAQLRNGLPRSKKTKLFTVLMLMINTVGVIEGALLPFRNPESPRSLTTLLSVNPKQLPTGAKCLVALVHFIILGFHHFGLWLQVATVFNFAWDLVTTMKLLHKSSHSNPIQIAKHQRALSALQRICSVLYGQWVLAMQVACLVVTVLNLYMAVKLGSTRGLVQSIWCGIATCSFWRVLGDVNATSEEILMDYKRSEAAGKIGWFSRILRSLRPISIPLGSFFYVDRRFVLTYVSLVVNNAANLILAE